MGEYSIAMFGPAAAPARPRANATTRGRAASSDSSELLIVVRQRLVGVDQDNGLIGVLRDAGRGFEQAVHETVATRRQSGVAQPVAALDRHHA